MMRRLLAPLLLGPPLVLCLAACREVDAATAVLPPAANGVIVVCAGDPATGEGASLAVLPRGGTALTPNIYEEVNGGEALPAGLVFAAANPTNQPTAGRTFLVLSRAEGSVAVLDARTLTALPVAQRFWPALRWPRRLLFLSADKAYVTEHLRAPGEADTVGRVQVLIPLQPLGGLLPRRATFVGARPEHMARIGGIVYVALAGEARLPLLNAVSDTLLGSLALPSPAVGLEPDEFSNLWVLCAGATPGGASQGASLVLLDGGTGAVLRTIALANGPQAPRDLHATGDRRTLYYLHNNALWRLSVAGPTPLPELVLARPADVAFTGMGVDFRAGGTVYALRSTGPATPGWLYRLRAATTPATGLEVQDSFAVGRNPVDLAF